MKINMHKKRFIISAVVLAMMLMPFTMSAQGPFGSDNYFRINEDNYSNRASDPVIVGNINNQTFGQDVPVGSGIAVLVAAGAGYAIMKRRKNNAKN